MWISQLTFGSSITGEKAMASYGSVALGEAPRERARTPMIALGLAALAVLVTVAVVSSGSAAKPSELLVTAPSGSGLEQGGGDGGSSARRVVCRATGSQ